MHELLGLERVLSEYLSAIPKANTEVMAKTHTSTFDSSKATIISCVGNLSYYRFYLYGRYS